MTPNTGKQKQLHRTCNVAVCVFSRKSLIVLLHLCKALAAKNRSVVAGLERNSSLATALCASSHKVLSLGSTGVLSCCTAFLASLRLVLESLFSIELLLAGSENKFLAAILTSQCLVLVHLFYLAFKIWLVVALNGLTPSSLITIGNNALIKLLGHI